MKELIISGDDEWITKMKAHLEKEHPKTRGKMWIQDKIIEKRANTGKPMGLKAGFKESFKNIGDATKKAMDPIEKVMEKIEKDLKF